MCRICGRVVKCIFDTMPSRAHHVPSRRAFSTIRRVTNTPQVSPAFVTPSSAIPNISRAFSGLSIRPTSTSCISTASIRPSLSSTLPKIGPTTSQLRLFSASAALGAKRDTYDPSRRVQKRRHGFLSRAKTRTGRALIKRRRLKGRLSVSW